MELVSGCSFEIGEGFRLVRDVGDTQLYENSLPGVCQLIRELFYYHLAHSFAFESASKVKRRLYSLKQITIPQFPPNPFPSWPRHCHPQYQQKPRNPSYAHLSSVYI